LNTHDAWTLGDTMTPKEFLDGLGVEDRERLRGRMVESRHNRDDVVISQNDATLDVFFVLEGTARAQGLSEEGRLVTYREIPEGAIFGELSAIDALPRSADVVATGPLTVGRLTQSEFRSVVDTDNAFRWALLSYMTEQSRIMTARIFEFSTMVVRERLIGELVRMADGLPDINGRVEIKPAPTHADLASRIATHREAVSREMSALTKDGIIGKGHKTLIVNNVAELQALRDKKAET
ncbi:MAG: Crp/Fnr family transcriptional regulator, partial [Pseudomonadota bacterium]